MYFTRSTCWIQAILLKGRLTDQYLQKWNEELCNASKMRTYKSYKSELVMESYVATFASADSTPKIQNKLPPIKN